MQFCLLKVSRSIVAASAFAFLTSLVSVPSASAQAAGAQQPAGQPAAGQAAAGQGAAAAPSWTDRAEYDTYTKITQTTDPKARLALLDAWQDKYPTSAVSATRAQLYVQTLAQLAPTDPSVRQKLLDKANEVLKADPKNFVALYQIAVWGPVVGGANPSPDLLSQVQNAAQGILDNAGTVFDPKNKPSTATDEAFATAKTQALTQAHNDLAWVATVKKDNATAENEYKASLQVNANQGAVSYQYGKLLVDDKKYPDALFEFARAAQYTGPGAVPAASQPQLLNYFKTVYKEFHGSEDGEDQVLTQAKTNALPPPDFQIVGQAEIAQKNADAMNARIAADPGFGLWYSIKTNLTGDQGDQFFQSNVKDAEIPGGANGVKNFTGTIISVDPADKPTKVVVGVEDPTKPDATLVFSNPLPAAALDKIKVGEKVDFSGVADSYTKDPYMLTFTDPTIPGVETNAPAKKPAAGRGRGRGRG